MHAMQNEHAMGDVESLAGVKCTLGNAMQLRRALHKERHNTQKQSSQNSTGPRGTNH
jgi:hypothetical protein